jgi:hypothetical protein
VLEEYQDAVKTTIAKRRNIERLKASSNIRPERVDDALEELEEANKVEQHIHRRVEGISQNLHRALHRHSRLAHEDLMAALIEHARTNIMYEKQLLRELESLKPDVRASADPAPPSTAPIAPLAALNRSATMPAPNGAQRQTITSGHFLPPSLQTSGKAMSQPGPQPIITPSPTAFMPPTQVLSPNAPVTPISAALTDDSKPTSPVSTSVAAFPRTNQFVNQPINTDGSSSSIITPGFPRTSQFVSPARPNSRGGSATPPPVTPGFPKTTQFVNPAPTTPLMTPGFPKTNMFTNQQTPVTPGFPRTNQFVGNTGPLGSGAVASPSSSTGGYNVFPRTSQFLPGVQPPMSSPGMSPTTSVDGRQLPGGPNGLTSPGYDQSRMRTSSQMSSSTPIRSPLSQSQVYSESPAQQQPQYQQPALPSQIQQQQQQQLQQSMQNVDPLGGGSRIISNQPVASNPPMLPHTPLSASVSGLPSRAQVDPLLGSTMNGGMSQSMFVSPSTPRSAYDPLGGAEISTPGGTVRGVPGGGGLGSRSGTPGRGRLDAREAASKLANFL